MKPMKHTHRVNSSKDRDDKWSFDSKRTRAQKVYGTIIDDKTCSVLEYVHHANGILTLQSKGDIHGQEHAGDVFNLILDKIDPSRVLARTKEGRWWRKGKKHRSIEGKAIRESMGLKPGESAFHPEIN